MTDFWLGAAAGASAAALAFAGACRRQRRRLAALLGFAVHEANTPLTAVNMTVLNLLDGVFGAVSPEQQPWIDMLREQTTRLAQLLGELRDFIHLELQGELVVGSARLDPTGVVREAARGVARGLAQANAELTVVIEPELPAIRADDDRFGRTLLGLLHHARKFRTDGPVELSARRAGGDVDIVVRFRGPGLTQAEARRSLELFYAADSQRRHALAASGLGLGMARALLRLQGCELDVLLEPDGRTALRVRARAAS